MGALTFIEVPCILRKQHVPARTLQLLRQTALGRMSVHVQRSEWRSEYAGGGSVRGWGCVREHSNHYVEAAPWAQRRRRMRTARTRLPTA